MRRLLAPLSAVALLAAIIGCGGAAASLDDGSTSGDSSGGTGQTLLPGGTYTAAYAGSDTASGSFSGTGTGSVVADGTLTLTYTPSGSSTARVLTAKPTTANSVIGTVKVGTDAPFETLVSLTDTSGVYKVTSVFTLTPGLTQTDAFTLTATRPTAGTYKGSHPAADATTSTNVDNHGASYTSYSSALVAGPAATVAANGTMSLTYASRRSKGSTVQIHQLSTTLLADGTFSGSLGIGALGGSPDNSLPVTGAWSLGAGNVVTLRLDYVNTTITDVGYPSPNPTVHETLKLTRQ